MQFGTQPEYLRLGAVWYYESVMRIKWLSCAHHGYGALACPDIEMFYSDTSNISTQMMLYEK